MFKKILILVMVCSLCFTMSACFEIEEKVAIKSDGGASSLLRLRMYLPKDKKKGPDKPEITKEGIGEGIDGVKSVSVSAKEVFGQFITEVSMETDSWKALAKAYNTLPKDSKKSGQNDQIDKLFTEKGFYNLKKKGNKILITRILEPAKKKKKKKESDEAFGDIFNMMMGSVNFRVELKVPSTVISSNAEEVDGRTLKWVIPVDYVSKHKVVLKVEIESTPELIKALF